MKQLRHGSSSLTSSKYRRSLNRRCPIREVSCHQLLQSCHSVTPTWVTWDGATLHPPGLPGTVLLYTHLGYLGRCYFTPTWVTWDGATLHPPGLPGTVLLYTYLLLRSRHLTIGLLAQDVTCSSLVHSCHLRRPSCMNCRAASTSSHSGPLLCLSVPAPRPIIPLAATTKMPLQVHLGCGPYTPARYIHRDLIDQADSPTSLM
jgi:hypothetical protein